VIAKVTRFKNRAAIGGKAAKRSANKGRGLNQNKTLYHPTKLFSIIRVSR
jgi:hypothetical protein